MISRSRALLVNPWSTEIREGIFEWKIERFLEKHRDRSIAFRFGTYNCVLFFQKFDEHTDFVLQCNELFEKDIFRELTYYKASILSSDEAEYFSVLGSVRTGQDSFPLMHFFVEDHEGESSEEDHEDESSEEDHEDESSKEDHEDESSEENYEDESSEEDHEDESSEEDHEDESSEENCEDESSEEDHEDESSEEGHEGESFKVDHKDKYEFVTQGILTFRLSWSYCNTNLDPLLWMRYEDKTCEPPNLLISGADHMELAKKLLKDIHALHENNTNPDCILKVGDKLFPVNRAILSARSEVFAAMFRHNTMKNSSSVVEIQDIEADVLDDMLHYVYKGSLGRLNVNNAAAMFDAVHKYALIEARRVCLKVLMHNLTLENVGDAIFQAQVHKLSALKSIILAFIENNFDRLVETNTWKEFSKTEPYLAIQYLQSALIATTIKLKSAMLLSRPKCTNCLLLKA